MRNSSGTVDRLMRIANEIKEPRNEDEAEGSMYGYLCLIKYSVTLVLVYVLPLIRTTHFSLLLLSSSSLLPVDTSEDMLNLST
jgi:hypothetical protein